jgi:putative SOS response-associated peptidase YedK
MCGRFNLRTNPQRFAEFFQAAVRETDQQLLLRYNIAPTQPVLAVRLRDGDREAVPLQWGLIPSWSRDPKIGGKMINARAETVAEKPSFRTAFKRRRCLIPASGFYEWDRSTQPKQPYHITPAHGGLMAFAGLWERWSPPEGEPLESCTILTTAANQALQSLHDRMPVILLPETFSAWLDEQAVPDDLGRLLQPAPEDFLDWRPISTRVNNVRNQGEDCIAPLVP